MKALVLGGCLKTLPPFEVDIRMRTQVSGVWLLRSTSNRMEIEIKYIYILLFAASLLYAQSNKEKKSSTDLVEVRKYFRLERHVNLRTIFHHFQGRIHVVAISHRFRQSSSQVS